MAALAVAACLHGTVGLVGLWDRGPLQALEMDFYAGEECIYNFCCDRGVRPAGNWGTGAYTATPRVYVTTCLPGLASSAGMLQGST